MSADEHGEDEVGALVKHQPANDFSQVLIRTMEAIKNDPAQFRNLVYEMARVQLQKEAWHRDPPMGILELRRTMLALETAIERVETASAQRDAMPMLAPSSAAIADSDLDDLFEPDPRHKSIEVIEPARIERVSPPPAAVRVEPRRPPPAGVRAEPKRKPSAAMKVEPRQTPPSRMPGPLKTLARFGVLASVAAVAAVVVVVADRQFHVFDRKAAVADKRSAAPQPTAASPLASTAGVNPPPTAPVQTAALNEATTQAAVPAPLPAAPATSALVPSVYGVYAVSAGKLFELEALPGRVPDQRVFMSAIVKAPSNTVLPDGEVTFIVYRRDVASNAPDRVPVRVIARVMHALTFDKNGKPKTVNVDDAWAVRNVTFDYRVAPASESPEMIVIKPEKEDFALPPGRYGLVIKGLAYDFSVDGRVTAATQCLERTEAANGTFYSECRAL